MWPEAWWSIMQYLFLVLQNNTKVTIYVYYNGNLAFIIILLGFIWKYGVFSSVVITPKTSDIKYLAMLCGLMWSWLYSSGLFRVLFRFIWLNWVEWCGVETSFALIWVWSLIVSHCGSLCCIALRIELIGRCLFERRLTYYSPGCIKLFVETELDTYI